MQRSSWNRSISAAIRDAVSDEDGYARLYRTYMGVDPRIQPPPDDGARWEEPDGVLSTVLDRGTVRVAFRELRPYTFRDGQGTLRGFEHDLAIDVARRLGTHYGRAVEVEWVERDVPLVPGQEQQSVMNALAPLLASGECDLVLSGLLILEEWGERVVPTAGTMVLFTDAIYTGLDGLDFSALRDRSDLIKFMAARTDVEFLIGGVGDNPGPTPAAVHGLIADVQRAGGRASSRLGPIAQVLADLAQARAHLVLGDSIALSAASSRPDFKGRNLNLQAGPETLLLGGFTA